MNFTRLEEARFVAKMKLARTVLAWQCAALVSALAQGQQLALAALPKGGGACRSDDDCQLAGICNASAQCACDAAWRGAHCEALHLLPASRTAQYPRDANTAAQSTWTWGGAAIRDGADGRVHMYVTEWQNHCPMTYPDFITQTHIVHVVADPPDGPFVRAEPAEVVPTAAGNPVIARATDGTYLLYFTNYRYAGPLKNCSSAATITGQRAAAAAEQQPVKATNTACGIHLAHAKSLDGPWSLVYGIAYGAGGSQRWDNCTLTNPGPFVFPNSTVLMMFKLCRYAPNCPNGRYISGLLTSPLQPDAAGTPPYLLPYTRRVRADPLVNASVGDSIEDPSNGWMDARGHLHMLMHVGANAGGSLHSRDGVDWAFNTSLVSYPPTINYVDGSVLHLDQRQEPRLLLDPASGQPTHLINICGTGGLAHTFVCLQPICTSALVALGHC